MKPFKKKIKYTPYYCKVCNGDIVSEQTGHNSFKYYCRNCIEKKMKKEKCVKCKETYFTNMGHLDKSGLCAACIDEKKEPLIKELPIKEQARLLPEWIKWLQAQRHNDGVQIEDFVHCWGEFTESEFTSAKARSLAGPH